MARRGARQRDPLREKFWRRTIREQQRSGLSVRDFCQREGLKEGVFRWWRQELPRRDGGGRTAAVLSSFTGTCKHHDIDPFAYLRDILRRLPSQPAGKLDELLPDVWFAAHPLARRKTAA